MPENFYFWFVTRLSIGWEEFHNFPKVLVAPIGMAALLSSLADTGEISVVDRFLKATISTAVAILVLCVISAIIDPFISHAGYTMSHTGIPEQATLGAVTVLNAQALSKTSKIGVVGLLIMFPFVQIVTGFWDGVGDHLHYFESATSQFQWAYSVSIVLWNSLFYIFLWLGKSWGTIMNHLAIPIWAITAVGGLYILPTVGENTSSSIVNNRFSGGPGYSVG